MFPDGNFSLRAMAESHYCSRSGTREARNVSGRPASSETSPNGREQAARFGAAVRERREAPAIETVRTARPIVTDDVPAT